MRAKPGVSIWRADHLPGTKKGAGNQNLDIVLLLSTLYYLYLIFNRITVTLTTISRRDWVNQAIEIIEADFNRSADTHLVKLNWPVFDCVDIYLKDESTHPTGSLKHRLARSLFLYALCNGWINQDTPVIESSSGSTAVSEAYFAALIGVPFIAVMPKSISCEKIEKIKFYGGECHFVDSSAQIYQAAENLAVELDGHYIDQFTYAERATDWRGNNNIAESIFEQISKEPHCVPHWIVMSAGTGGTSATLGRYIRYQKFSTRLCVADPENSVFYDYYNNADRSLKIEKGSLIEGIGRPRVEPSFMPDIIDRMEKIPDAASIACLSILETRLKRKCGGSTGTNLFATLKLASEMQIASQCGSIVTLICDAGERYLDTYYNPQWLKSNNINTAPYMQKLAELESGNMNALFNNTENQNIT